LAEPGSKSGREGVSYQSNVLVNMYTLEDSHSDRTSYQIS
jgi:hypothetical protein